MIFYFSGTGNSKWIAEKIAMKLGEEALDIAKLYKEGLTTYRAKSGEVVGLVFPVYAWRAPEMVTNFARNIKLKEDNYTFAVCSCGDESALALQSLAQVFKMKSGFSIIMPNNYMVGFKLDDQDIIENKISAANSRIIGICQHIQEKEEVFDCYKGNGAFMKSNLINFLFNAFARDSKAFRVEESCDGCGVCVANCTGNNIDIVEGHPKWTGKCNMCFSCINRCPKEAIQYKSKTINKGRYVFDEKYLGKNL